MERILERYERYSYAERQLLANDLEQNVYATNRLNKFQIPESYYREFLFIDTPLINLFICREAGLWNMQSSRLGLRFYKEIKSTNLNAGIYILSIMKETKPKY